MAARSKLSVMRMVPSAPERAGVLRRFARREGVLVSFSPALLRSHTPLLESDGRVESVLFGEWVRRCLIATDGPSRPFASQDIEQEAVAEALRRLPEGAALSEAARFGGGQRAVQKAISDLRNAGLRPDDLRRVAQSLEPELADKLASLAFVETEVDSWIGELGRGGLAGAIEECTAVPGVLPLSLRRALVLVGDEWPECADRFCRWLLESGGTLRMLGERHAGNVPLFRASERAAHGAEASGDPSGRSLARDLFGDDATENCGIDVRIVATSGTLQECEYALRHCRKAIEGGSSPRRLAIFARDVTTYGPLLESAARRQGVPLSFSRRAPLLSVGWTRVLIDTLRALAGRDIRALIPLSRSGYLGLSRLEQLEATTEIRLAHGADGNAWSQLGQSIKVGPIAKLLAWRESVSVRSASLAEWIGHLGELRRLLKPDAEKPCPTDERDGRADRALDRALNAKATVANLLGGLPLAFARFVAVCGEVAEEAEVYLPASDGGVAVLSDSQAYRDFDDVWVMGLLEGQFPKRRREDPVLTDAERTAISSASYVRIPDSTDIALRERDAFYRLAVAARRTLILSYPETSDEQDNIPAFYLDAAQRAAGNSLQKLTVNREALTPDIDQCLSLADQNLCLALRRPSIRRKEDSEFLTQVAREALTGPQGRLPTPSELRDVLRCPFQYLGRRRLALRPAQQATRWASLRTLPVKARLAGQPSPEAAGAALVAELELALSDLSAESLDWELAALRSGAGRRIAEWIGREFEARQAWQRQNTRFRVPFDELDEGQALRRLGVGGIAEAVSESQAYRIVHMYERILPDMDDGGFVAEADELFFGLHMLAAYRKASASFALEVETLGHGRTLLVAPRKPSISGVAKAQLSVKDVSTEDNPIEAAKALFARIRTLTREAKARIERLEIRATPSEACDWCDLGELCRRSRHYGDQSDCFRAEEDDE